MPQIRVHEKALAHLSRGLYRSPASALRELVSNAWDANARVVRISTNYPLFMRLAVEDDGDGFSSDTFSTLMDGGIGNSEKRVKTAQLRDGRPMIGRLGIGMLGIAQICGSFTVTSKMKNGEGFRANVHLYDFLKENLDKKEATIEVDVGTYDFDNTYDIAQAPFGTSIATDDVHPTFARAFQQSLEFEAFRDPPSEWRAAIKIAAHVHSIQELGDYWRLLWELSASCPIPYVSADAVPSGLVKGDQKLLESYDFKVTVDSLELRKPVYLKGNKAGYTTFRIDPQHFTPYSKDLRFHGYVAVQEGMQLKPDELRGILVRIKNVAIGYYDPTMLDYRYNQGPRSRWITGEIYIDEGLEDALNIDRDSFNRFHPQFKEMQSYVHRILRDELFPEVYKQIEKRSSAKADHKKSERGIHLSHVLTDAMETKVSIRQAHTKAQASSAYPTVVKRKDGFAVVMPDDSSVATRKSQKQLALSILALFEIVMRESTNERRREGFRRALLALLAKW